MVKSVSKELQISWQNSCRCSDIISVFSTVTKTCTSGSDSVWTWIHTCQVYHSSFSVETLLLWRNKEPSHWNANCWHFSKCSSDAGALWIVSVMRTMKEISQIFICLLHSAPRAECFRVGSCHIKYVWCGPAVSELDDIPRKPLRWPHKRCDRRCLPNSWHIELTLQNNPVLASAVVYSPRLILPISCLCTELLLPHWNRFNIITFHTTYWHWLPYSQCCQFVQINSIFSYYYYLHFLAWSSFLKTLKHHLWLVGLILNY